MSGQPGASRDDVIGVIVTAAAEAFGELAAEAVARGEPEGEVRAKLARVAPHVARRCVEFATLYTAQRGDAAHH